MQSRQAQVAQQESLIRKSDRQRFLFDRCLKNLKHILEDFTGTPDTHPRLDPESFDEEIGERLLGIAQNVVTTQQSLEDQKAAMRALKDDIAALPEEPLPLPAHSSSEENNERERPETGEEGGVDMWEKYKSHRAEAKKLRKTRDGEEPWRKHDAYRGLSLAVRRLVDPEGALGDDDLEESMTTTDTRVTIKDPISQQPITDPVRNVFCKHPFDRKVILEYLARIKKTKKPPPRCPHIGCANQEPLKPEDFEDYPELLTDQRAHRPRVEESEESSVDLADDSTMETD